MNKPHRLPFSRVVSDVRSERLLKKQPSYRTYWWQFAHKGTAWKAATANLDEVLVIALVSKTVMPIRVSAGQVFSHKLAVFATDRFTDQAVLSSDIHWLWAVVYSSTLETRVNYSPSDAYVTFPRPEPTSALEIIGRTLDTERREIMLRRDLGLTKLYNLVNDPGLEAGTDPDVDRMRTIHVDLDAAVAAAYGWNDLDLTHGFHTYRKMTRWTLSPATRVEILDRLLEENHRRAAAEAASLPAKKTRGKRRTQHSQEETLDV